MQVTLKNIRIAFPELFTPALFKGKDDSKPRYSARLVIPADHPGVADVEAAIAAVAKEGWPKQPKILDTMRGNSNKFCFIDGDLSGDEQFAGTWLLSAHRSDKQGRPTVVNRDRTPLAEEDGKIYGGCVVNAIVDIWAQTTDYPGIRCKLEAVQFVGDADAFAGGGARITGDAFDDLSEGSDAAEFV